MPSMEQVRVNGFATLVASVGNKEKVINLESVSFHLSTPSISVYTDMFFLFDFAFFLLFFFLLIPFFTQTFTLVLNVQWVRA